MFKEADPLYALQAAQYSRLNGDEMLKGWGVKVFDRVDEDYFPRACIGEDESLPDDSDCAAKSDVMSTVRVYTDTVGKGQAKRITERIRFLLTRASGFKVAGFQMSIGHCERIRILDHEDRLRVQGVVYLKYRLIAV